MNRLILDGLADRQALRQIALLLDKRPIALNDADAKEICAALRRIAGEPEEAAGHYDDCPSLKITFGRKVECTCRARVPKTQEYIAMTGGD